jgi:lipopolysaccharide transport system ATP-binding protein
LRIGSEANRTIPPDAHEYAVIAEDVGKSYQLGELRSIQQYVLSVLRGGGGKDVARRGTRPSFMALEDVSFRIRKGECFAILGSNGSGKSTLVSLISEIIVPTFGRLIVQGRTMPLIEVGSGFHPELTGRENVNLFGTVLGMRAKEIRKSIPAMLEFAEMDEPHFDTPLKRLSTGMQARLAFALAMRFPADLYIFDEVMAVVDDHFRAKAIREISNLSRQGSTIIFISHDLDTVRSICQAGLWLYNGKMRGCGPIERIADAYAEFQAAEDAAQLAGVAS